MKTMRKQNNRKYGTHGTRKIRGGKIKGGSVMNNWAINLASKWLLPTPTSAAVALPPPPPAEVQAAAAPPSSAPPIQAAEVSSAAAAAPPPAEKKETEKEEAALSAAKDTEKQKNLLTNLKYGWPENFKELPAIPSNDKKSLEDLIQLLNRPDGTDYKPVAVIKIIEDNTHVYLPAGIFDVAFNSESVYKQLQEYKQIYEMSKKMSVKEIQTALAFESDDKLREWIIDKTMPPVN